MRHFELVCLSELFKLLVGMSSHCWEDETSRHSLHYEVGR